MRHLKKLLKTMIPTPKKDKVKDYVDFDPIQKGLPTPRHKDFYYFLIQSSWPSLLFLLFCTYIISNLVFAALYYYGPGHLVNSPDKTFLDTLFFSVQTLSTIGYGTLAPVGIYSNLIVTLEVAYGLIGVAVVTGMIFAKLSKPRANVLFSNALIYSKFNGEYCLSLRIGNARNTEIVEAKTRVSALIEETTLEGEHVRRVHNLELLRSETPFFSMSWSLYHVVDKSSPLYGINFQEQTSLKAIIVTMTGHDEAYSSKIYARQTYLPTLIQKDRYFEDVIQDTPSGQPVIDYEKFHTLK